MRFVHLQFAFLMCALSTRAFSQAAPQFVLRPALTLDRVLDRLELNRISEGIYTRDGHFVFINARAARLEVLSPDGRVEASIGRSGGGPGEFRSPGRLAWVGDTLWVYDGTLRRVTHVLGRATVRTTPYSTSIGARFEVMEPLAFDKAGNDVGIGVFSRGMRDRAALDRGFPVLRRNARTTTVDTLSWLTRRNWNVVLPFVRAGVPAELQIVQPLSDAPLYAARRSGGFVIVERFVGRPEQFSVQVYRADGSLQSRRTISYTPIPVTRQVRDSVLAPFARAGMAFSESELKRDLFLPASLPTVTDIVGASDGLIWLRREDPLALPAQRYTVMTDAGVLLGDAMLPRDARVLDSRNGRVMVMTRDDDDLPVLTAYTFQVPDTRGAR